MSRPCSVCIRADLPWIDAAIRGEASLRQLERETGIPKSVLHRHSKHLGPEAKRPFTLSLTNEQMEMARLPFTPSGRAWVGWRKRDSTPDPAREEPYDPLRWELGFS